MGTTIKVIEFETGECVHEIDVTGKTERQIEQVERGLNLNLNHNKFYTEVN